MTFKAILQKTYRESKGVNPLTFIFCLLVQYFIQSLKTHSKAFFILQKLQFFKQEIAEFYLAEIFYFYGDFERSLEYLNNFLNTNPNHADAIYLKATLLALLGQKQESLNLLGSLLQTSSRLKTWIMLARVVQDLQDFLFVHRLFVDNANNFPNFIKHRGEILRQLSNGAINARDFTNAKALLKESLLIHQSSNSRQKQQAIKSTQAKEALEELSALFVEHNITMFLVSGTFLGCVRGGDFISYDKDIDVGIYQCDLDRAREIIQTAKSFYCSNPLKNYRGGIQIRHLNNIYIDVFAHYVENNRIYHNGDFVRWWNSEFELDSYHFLGREYLAPKDYELYLSENYGEWRIPRNSTTYHTYLSTPNMEIIDKERFICALYNMLFTSPMQMQILDRLKELGEGNFVEEYLALKRSEQCNP